jgi:hypothetical protein
MLPWAYIANATSMASVSLVGNAKLISKIYFPRLVVPIAAVIALLADRDRGRPAGGADARVRLCPEHPQMGPYRVAARTAKTLPAVRTS